VRSIYKSLIEERAIEASKVTTYDPERQKAFIEGAKFAISKLADCIRPNHYDDMMSKGSLEYVNKLRLNDVRDALDMLTAMVETEASK
jgi:hypothetical protein